MSRKRRGLKYNMIRNELSNRKRLVSLCKKVNISRSGPNEELIDGLLELPISTLREAVDAYGSERQRYYLGKLRKKKRI